MEISKNYGQLRKQIFEEYVPDESLKEVILCQNPVPDNIDNVKKLDDFLRDILKERVKHAQNIETILEKLQRKTVDVNGSSVEVMQYSRGSKRGRRRCCPNIFK